MEKFKHKNGMGTLFFQEKAHEKQPDIKGNAVAPDGTELKISGWKKSGAKGEFYSIAIEVAGQYNNSAPSDDRGGLPF